MWPIALGIVVFIGGYTYVRLAYAKPGHAHEPFAESRRRADTDKLTAAGWTRSELDFEPVVEQLSADAPVKPVLIRPSAVDELQRLDTENWNLPIEYTVVSAPAKAAGGLRLAFQASLDQARAQISGFTLFRKGGEVVLLPRWEPIPEELIPRRPVAGGRVAVPESALPPGRYSVILPAIRQSSTLELEVVAPATPAP
jgi:hypothetical protein